MSMSSSSSSGDTFGPGPDGMCEGQPCYTQQNIAYWQAVVTDISSQLIDLEFQVAMKQQELETAKTNRDNAIQNQCP